MKRKKLKGGSLAGTYIIQNEESNKKYVRKEISNKHNREYGFQRWYSQLKRLQRFSLMFPGHFPVVEEYGYENEMAYFDMPFLESYKNCFDVVKKSKSELEINNIFNLIIEKLSVMHSRTFKSSKNAMQLYVQEEIMNKIQDALKNNRFARFYEYDKVVLNGNVYTSLSKNIEKYIQFGTKNYKFNLESYTHGNVTLENIMYSELNNDVIFIDPYEENIIDNKYNEYSQLLQSCHGLYEILNNSIPEVSNNTISVEHKNTFGLIFFNELFWKYLKSNLTNKEINIVRFFEASQFIRMLPFKMEADDSKMILFYGIASMLVDDLLTSDG
tara:strand:+ start:858 stop:1841 length:984 start_codon:yes stop_codon:yes gene_type:complete